MYLVLLIILIVICLGGLPQVSGSWHSYGYAPSGFALLIVIVLLVVIFSGRL